MSRRSTVEYERDKFLAIEMHVAGRSTDEITQELNVSLRTAQRFLRDYRQARKPKPPVIDELTRRRRWEAEKDARQKMENGGKLTLRPEAGMARRRIEQFGFDLMPGEFPQ